MPLDAKGLPQGRTTEGPGPPLRPERASWPRLSNDPTWPWEGAGTLCGAQAGRHAVTVLHPDCRGGGHGKGWCARTEQRGPPSGRRGARAMHAERQPRAPPNCELGGETAPRGWSLRQQLTGRAVHAGPKDRSMITCPQAWPWPHGLTPAGPAIPPWGPFASVSSASVMGAGPPAGEEEQLHRPEGPVWGVASQQGASACRTHPPGLSTWTSTHLSPLEGGSQVAQEF